MDKAALFSYEEDEGPARDLATRLGVRHFPIKSHNFPDGESLIRVDGFAEHAILYRRLDRPNDKLFEMLLVADALKRNGATKLTLVAPYLPYMRQDKAFREGEAVSQQVLAKLFDPIFDNLVCVDPHLHRTPDLGKLFPKCQVLVLSAAPVIAHYLESVALARGTLILGPDEESKAWAGEVAGALNLEVAVSEKVRRGDRDVEIALPQDVAFEGRQVILVDDIASSGSTLMRSAEFVRSKGGGPIDVCVTHALFPDSALAQFERAGIRNIVSCDGVAHSTNRISLAPLLADALDGAL